MKQYSVQYIQLSTGETMAYRHCGNGPRNLVLIHGNMSSSVHFQPLMELLEPHFTIYAMDMRGFGDSSYLHGFNTLEELADEVAEFLKVLSISEPILLGWSTGGGVALELAARKEVGVRGLVLLSSVGLMGYPMLRKDAAYQPIMGDYLLKREDIAADPVQVAPVLAAYEKSDREFFRMLWNAVIYCRAQPSAEDYELYLDAILKQRNLVDVDYSLVHFNVTDEPSPVQSGSNHARYVKCPVVIVHGEADMVVPKVNAEQTKEFFGEQAELHILPGLSHSIITDDCAALADILAKLE
ncbi:MAG: alpha/beta hydrolase [Oscillospiraceae bacterium]|nr:alpha/beta hydrolase [Oscillospiraceae bacterium]